MMADVQNELASFAKARANVYGLLADVFRDAPSEAFLETLGAPEFSGALDALDLSLGALLDGTDLAAAASRLTLEYTRLFLGPGPRISPHESMHIPPRFGETNELWSEATVAVKKFIEATGLRIDDAFTGMPDHITAEFEFMQRLALEEADARERDDAELGGNIRGIQARFFDEHLSRWIPTFCEKVIESASEPFYRAFSEIAQEFISFEAQGLAQAGETAHGGDRLPA